MKTQDPILNQFRIVVGRVGWFIALAATVAIALWLGLLTGCFDYPGDEHWAITRMALTNAYPWVSAVFWLCISVGVLFTTVLYLAIALWWRKRGGDLHHRGARFIDQRARE